MNAGKTTLGAGTALVLGGSGFIGVHVVETLRARGYAVTTFDRDALPAHLAGQVESCTGDRSDGIGALGERDWDAVIDLSGYVPRWVRLATESLHGKARRYIFLSSICAYRDFTVPGIDEEYPLAALPDSALEDMSYETYGPFKAVCEQIVAQRYGERATALRPPYVVGPGDLTARFAYWPRRVARGGAMLAPGSAADPIQFIDVRDLAEFICHCAERDIGGRYNVCTPAGAVTMGELLETSRRVSESNAKFIWADASALPENYRMGGGGDVTIWAPRGGAYRGWPFVSSARAVSRGLRFRDLEVTVRDTLVWWQERPAAERQKARCGMTPEREAQWLGELADSRWM